MAIVSLAFFYPDNFEGNSLRQPDMVQGAANGHEAQLWQEATGEKALWTNSLFGGMPTFQISPSYPSNSLFSWINTVYGLWLPSPSNLLFMMMMGFLILMFALGKRWYYALIGALAWGFSSYFVIIIGAGHIWKFIALAYTPPLIAGLVLLYRGRYITGTALMAVSAMMQLAANHPQMSYYFAMVMLFVALAYLVDAFRRKALRRWLVASGLAVVAGVLALGANAPSLYNTYEYARHTKRAQSELAACDAEAPGAGSGNADRPTGGLPYSDIVGWSYGPSEMFSLIVPNIKGGASARLHGGDMVLASLAELDGAAGIDPRGPEASVIQCLPQYFNDSEGTNGPVYVGAIIAALFILGCFIVRGPLKWAMVAATVVAMVLALGYNAEGITRWMVYNFPMYNKFRAVESILVVAEFAIPLLAVLALAQFVEAGSDAWRRYRRPLVVSFGFCGAVAALAVVAPSAFGELVSERDHMNQNIQYLQMQVVQIGRMQNADSRQIEAAVSDYSLDNPAVLAAVTQLRSSLVRNDGLRSLLFLALGFAALAACGAGKMSRPVAVGAVGLMVLIDLYGADKRYVSHESFAAPVGHSQGIEADAIDRAILADTAGHYRVLDIPGFFDARRSYFHSMLGGYHAAKLSRYDDIIGERMLPLLSVGYGHADGRGDAAAGQAVADMLNARYIVTGDPEAPLMLNPQAMGNAWLVDSMVWVDGARAEMDALDPALTDLRRQAVADRSFATALPGQPSLAPGDTIYMTYYSPNTLKYHVSTAAGGVGVFSEVYFPWGWKATVDGNEVPLARVNYILRALAIPAGSHEIVMTFAPESVRRSSAAAYACVTLIYLLLAAGIFVECRRWRLF
jgi:hypothetical protein